MIPYVYAVVKGSARPSRVTWLIWSTLSWVILIASYQSGAKSTLFWLISAVFNSTLVLILSLWKGTWERSSLEFLCLGFGATGVLLWYVTRRAEYSVYVSMLVDVVAVLPTVKKVWRKAHSEPKIAWSFGFVAALLNVGAIDSLRMVILLPPFVVVGWHILVLAPMYLKRDIPKIS